MTKIAVAMIFLLALAACATSGHRFTVSMKRADCEGANCAESGKKIIKAVNVSQDNVSINNVFTYTDNHIDVWFGFFPDFISMDFQNNGTQSLKISWDDSVLITPNGISHGIVHSGTKLIDKNKSQKSSVIARGSKISEFLYPEDLIYFRETIERPLYIPGGWRRNPYLVPGDVGKEFSVLLVVKKDEAKMEYRFHFNVDGMMESPSSSGDTDDITQQK